MQRARCRVCHGRICFFGRRLNSWWNQNRYLFLRQNEPFGERGARRRPLVDNEMKTEHAWIYKHTSRVPFRAYINKKFILATLLLVSPPEIRNLNKKKSSFCFVLQNWVTDYDRQNRPAVNKNEDRVLFFAIYSSTRFCARGFTVRDEWERGMMMAEGLLFLQEGDE